MANNCLTKKSLSVILSWVLWEKGCEMIYSSVHERLHVFSVAEFWPLTLYVFNPLSGLKKMEREDGVSKPR